MEARTFAGLAMEAGGFRKITLCDDQEDMNSQPPRISIGLPTYNRPELLALALDCFRQQTFTDFELIISDNASPNVEVRRLCESYVQQDSRFRYIRQPVNQGAERNFWFVYEQSRAPLFVWASDDDLWSVDFLEKGVAALDSNPLASAWFCQVVNTNARGEILRTFPSFKRFVSGPLRFVNLARFLWEPEVLGKANLVFSIFRRQGFSELVDRFRGHLSSWGADMNLFYCYLCRFNLIVDDQVVLWKRVPVESLDPISNARLHIYPREERKIYFGGYRRAAAGTRYHFFTVIVLLVRSVYDYHCSGRARRDYEDWKDLNRARLSRIVRRFRARCPRSDA